MVVVAVVVVVVLLLVDFLLQTPSGGGGFGPDSRGILIDFLLHYKVPEHRIS